MWVASSSRRKTLPGAMIRTGGGPAIIVRICTGEVCERRMRPPSTKKVSCMSRAGWSGGVLSASKLCHSVSIQGPVRTSKPMPWKICSISRRTSVSGCSVPRRAPARRQRDVDGAREIFGQRGVVEPGQARADRALDAALGAVGGFADGGAVLGRQAAERLHQLGDLALLADVARLRDADLLLGGEPGDLAAELGGEPIQVGDDAGGVLAGHDSRGRPAADGHRQAAQPPIRWNVRRRAPSR